MLIPISAQMRAESGAHVMMTSGVEHGVLQWPPIGTKVVSLCTAVTGTTEVVFAFTHAASVGCGVLTLRTSSTWLAM
jgi:hypothetical protein